MKSAAEGNAAGASAFRRIQPMAVVKEQPPDFDDGPGRRSVSPARSHAAAAAAADAVQAAATAAAVEEPEDTGEEEEDESSDSATDEPARFTVAAALPHSKRGSRKLRHAQGTTAGQDAVVIARNRGARRTIPAPSNTSAAVGTGMRDR